MHIITEDGPPVLDKVLRMGVFAGRGNALCLRVELYEPWLQFASKMQNLNLISEPERHIHEYRVASSARNLLFECGQIAIGSIGRNIVDKWQMLLNICGRPIAKELIQQTLIAAIEAAILHCKLCDLAEGVHAGFEHKDARVEAVWPADIWSSGELVALKQFIAVLQHL